MVNAALHKVIMVPSCFCQRQFKNKHNNYIIYYILSIGDQFMHEWPLYAPILFKEISFVFYWMGSKTGLITIDMDLS